MTTITKNRITKARIMANNGFVQIAEYNAAKQPTVVHVPGSQAKQYTVIARRNGNLSVECLLDTGYGKMDCKGNQKTICYHCLAAVMEIAKAAGFQITAICQNRPDAELRARIGGEVMPVESFQGGKTMYMVYEKLYS